MTSQTSNYLTHFFIIHDIKETHNHRLPNIANTTFLNRQQRMYDEEKPRKTTDKGSYVMYFGEAFHVTAPQWLPLRKISGPYRRGA